MNPEFNSLVKQRLYEPSTIILNSTREETLKVGAGVLGVGDIYDEGAKESVWIHGQIVSPHHTHNNGCASQSHIEGIVNEELSAHILEIPYHEIAGDYSCFEYKLKLIDADQHRIVLEGSVISRKCRDRFEPKEIGETQLIITPNTYDGIVQRERSNSIRRGQQHYIAALKEPDYWKEFLQKIEQEGYHHPYMRLERTVQTIPEAPAKRNDEDVPF